LPNTALNTIFAAQLWCRSYFALRYFRQLCFRVIMFSPQQAFAFRCAARYYAPALVFALIITLSAIATSHTLT
jgi:hypothetical protein